MSVARFFQPRVRPKLLSGSPPAWLLKHPRRAYIEQVILATPPWVNHKEMLLLHKAKIQMTEITRIEHVLDHIIPLKHPMVCGLNVPWNLQILTRAQNAAKSNNWSPDQMELFP
jgi:5-methylcytosine-specific restriction endonuclease McrA